jgi:2-polyprenyl-3-methyl-5-hydroxy-6-metoxy-1,4-benzoquinol methylase
MPPKTSPSPLLAASKPPCRVCGSSRVEEKGAKRGRFIAADFRFYQCRECRFLFVEPVTDFHIYDDAYYAGQGPDPLVNYHEEYSDYRSTSRRFELADLVRFAQEHFSEPASAGHFGQDGMTWLDFGCGAGGLLKYLRDLGELVCGGVHVPLHPVGHDVGSYSERLKNDDDFEILGWDELDRAGAARFDIISCIEVLEHVPFPRAVIELLARSLKPGGLLILTTGNLDCPLARLQGIQFAYCVPEIHVSLFNPSLLSWLYREAGLTPILMRPVGTIKYRFLKNLARLPGGGMLAWLAYFPPALHFVDYLFGFSKMPFAIKPMSPAPAR